MRSGNGLRSAAVGLATGVASFALLLACADLLPAYYDHRPLRVTEQSSITPDTVAPAAPPPVNAPAPLPDNPGPPPPAPRIPGPVDAALEKLVSGSAAFVAPSRMALQSTAPVRLTLSAQRSAQQLADEMAKEGQTSSGAVKMSAIMRATLSGSGMEVKPSEMQEQAVSTTEDTSWSWTVTAQQPGQQILSLHLDAVVAINGEQVQREIRVFVSNVRVSVGWPGDFHGWVELIRQVSDDLKYLIATAIAAVTGLLHWWRARSHAHPIG